MNIREQINNYIESNDIDVSKLAYVIHISENTFIQKLSNDCDFDMNCLARICKALGLSIKRFI